MQNETFTNHRRFLWAWVSLAFVVLSSIFYYFQRPAGGSRGGSVYGYTMGVLATLGILYLMAYGIRRRAYHSAKTTLKGWLSAHVWLGLSLIVIVPLHSGFEMGGNLHSVAYLLMLVVIASGIWGAVNYRSLASKIESHRGGGSFKSLIEQFQMDSLTIEKLCAGKSDILLQIRNRLEVFLPKSYFQLLFSTIPLSPDEKETARELSHLVAEEKTEGIHLLQLCERKRKLAKDIQKEVRLSARLKLWLLIHLPLSVALIIAVFIHIFSVLLYR